MKSYERVASCNFGVFCYLNPDLLCWGKIFGDTQPVSIYKYINMPCVLHGVAGIIYA